MSKHNQCQCCGKKLDYFENYSDYIFNDTKPSQIFLCDMCHNVLQSKKIINMTDLRKNVLGEFIKSNFGLNTLFSSENQKEILDNLDKNHEFKLPRKKIKEKLFWSVLKILIGVCGIFLILYISKIYDANKIILVSLCLLLLVLVSIGISEIKFIRLLREKIYENSD